MYSHSMIVPGTIMECYRISRNKASQQIEIGVDP